jgi:hypothetical protein
VEAGACEDESVDEGNGDAAVNSLFEVAQHAAGGGAVEIELVAFASEERWDDDGLAVGDESDVTDEGFVEDGVNGGTIVVAPFGESADAGALGGSEGHGIRVAKRD